MGKVKTKWIEDQAITFPKLNDAIFGSGPNQIPTGDHTHPAPTSFFSNILINADFNVSQRKDSDTALTDGEYPLDQWYYKCTGTGVYSYERSTDVPTVTESGHKSHHSLKLTVATADTNIEASDYSFIAQPIEGQTYGEYAGLQMILSFWVKSSLTGTYCVAFTNMNDRSCVVEYTISSADTWELKAINIPLSYTGGTWNTANGLGLLIVFTLSGGTNYHASNPGAWENGYYFSSSNQVNTTETVGTTFQLSQVQFRPGDTVQQFQGLHFPTELFLCQRYYEKTYSHNIDPQTATTEGVIPLPVLTSKVSAWAFTYKNEKRSTPSISFIDTSGNLNCVTGVDDDGTEETALNILTTSTWNLFQVTPGNTGAGIKYDAKDIKLLTFYFHYVLESYII